MSAYIENTKNMITNLIDNGYQGYNFCKEKFTQFNTENEFMKKYFPYVTYIGLELLHYSLMIIVALCMLIGKISSILFYQWTKFMDLTGRKRIILDRETDQPYIERFYLFLTDRNETFPFNIFIHHILKSDNDELHDHPWFVGCQFHPEFTSDPRKGHPLFTGFIKAAKKNKNKK